MRVFVATCAIAGAFAFLEGCSSQQPVVVPHTKNDFGGVNMPIEDQIKALEANTTMPARFKERRLAMLRAKLAGKDASSPGPSGAQ